MSNIEWTILMRWVGTGGGGQPCFESGGKPRALHDATALAMLGGVGASFWSACGLPPLSSVAIRSDRYTLHPAENGMEICLYLRREICDRHAEQFRSELIDSANVGRVV